MSKDTRFMLLEDAIPIVLSLARENVIDESEQDETLQEERKRQLLVLDVVEDFYVNNVAQ